MGSFAFAKQHSGYWGSPLKQVWLLWLLQPFLHLFTSVNQSFWQEAQVSCLKLELVLAGVTVLSTVQICGASTNVIYSISFLPLKRFLTQFPPQMYGISQGASEVCFWTGPVRLKWLKNNGSFYSSSSASRLKQPTLALKLFNHRLAYRVSYRSLFRKTHFLYLSIMIQFFGKLKISGSAQLGFPGGLDSFFGVSWWIWAGKIPKLG